MNGFVVYFRAKSGAVPSTEEDSVKEGAAYKAASTRGLQVASNKPGRQGKRYLFIWLTRWSNVWS